MAAECRPEILNPSTPRVDAEEQQFNGDGKQGWKCAKELEADWNQSVRFLRYVIETFTPPTEIDWAVQEEIVEYLQRPECMAVKNLDGTQYEPKNAS